MNTTTKLLVGTHLIALVAGGLLVHKLSPHAPTPVAAETAKTQVVATRAQVGTTQGTKVITKVITKYVTSPQGKCQVAERIVEKIGTEQHTVTETKATTTATQDLSRDYIRPNRAPYMLGLSCTVVACKELGDVTAIGGARLGNSSFSAIVMEPLGRFAPSVGISVDF